MQGSPAGDSPRTRVLASNGFFETHLDERSAMHLEDRSHGRKPGASRRPSSNHPDPSPRSVQPSTERRWKAPRGSLTSSPSRGSWASVPRSAGSHLLEVSTSRRQLADDARRPPESTHSRRLAPSRRRTRVTGQPAHPMLARTRLATATSPSHPHPRLSPGAPRRVKGRANRASGSRGLAKDRPAPKGRSART